MRVIVLAALGYGLTLANPLTPPQRIPTHAVSYTISGVHYTLDDADPGSISRLTFQVAPNPLATTKVRARLISASDVFFACAMVSAGLPVWECPLHDVSVRAADLLTIEIGDRPAPAEYMLYLPIVRVK
jgi:hypothetical protein